MAGSGVQAVALLIGLLLASRISHLAAQAPGTYAEHVVTLVAVQSGEAEARRTIVRDARYDVTPRGDTLVVQVTELDLRTTAGDETVRHDTDGFVGGRWKLLPDTVGWRLVETPFVPAALEEVTDLAALMADFFPPVPPPALPVGTSAPGGDGRTWHRLPGDGLHADYAWTREDEVDTARAVGDSMRAIIQERAEERGEGSWRTDGAVEWSRRIVTHSEAIVAGRRIRARVEEEIRVQRLP